ncbi:MAG: hypothetical protein QOJ55_1470, partial [Solirubrobacteraceae bacterium]|nr:hypothetical protein [Solirubrobacteraceae bacterium]
DHLHEFHVLLAQSGLMKWSSIPHSYLAMTKPSEYSDESRLEVRPGQGRYLFVYPFVKTREWYRLAPDERWRIMQEHIRVGREYPSIDLNTSYSFGLDDQEFVVAFEGDERQRIMTEHIRMGREYPSIDLNTSYSFGLDDQEFVVAFETDDPADFLDLVQRLRTTESSSYTLRDTPVFTCIAASVERALGALDGDALTSGIDPLVTTPIT